MLYYRPLNELLRKLFFFSALKKKNRLNPVSNSLAPQELSPPHIHAEPFMGPKSGFHFSFLP